MIKADKGNVEISGSVETVAAEMIAILHEFVVWERLHSEKPAVEVEQAATALYEAWTHESTS